MTRVLIPAGALGLGYDRAALERGIANRPDIIAVDGGSTDSGPSYLGRGVSKYARASTKMEWRELMRARAEAGVPLVIGTAGTCGADAAVDWLFDITKEIAAEEGMKIKVATLRSGQTAETVKAALAKGRVRPLAAAPEISDQILEDCTNIVALAGAEQIAAALATGADVVIAGRTTDTAIIAALPLTRGDNAGAAWHGAKVGECGALATTQPNSGVIQIDFDASGFTIEPMAEAAAATAYTVSAHMLYENSDPFILYEPGGYLDVTGSDYRALDARRVRVEGSKWVPGPYTVKLEGARVVGYQSVGLAVIRDRHYVANARVWAADIETKVRAKIEARMGLKPDDFAVELRLIGMNATLGDLENRHDLPVEVGALGILTCPTPEQAAEAAKILNPYLLHHPLTEDEPMPTFAFPFSPAEMQRGALYEFCLNHVMELDDPMAAFKLELHEVGHG
ncbi:acyclic terpene utilization AtuA family protein [Xinfangfangia sp. CPCC 101601]|uniref:Acyclic terpene utilization AtuA family protein n=1 Tax=Pseudogemmobacter lacusdianii TaxID=3069608 RepID=A0ABU0VWJ0_9RHOB|nr:acyclic terpene utilization AtuA family protein [Xinfangfangia sp. CPCC 101601]MDQ2066127.1 acyclic terpene utilization AtuA family protein [Xinfangfangia sp. CPCC 101601]